MRGHTYRRGKSWTCVWDEPREEDGKRKQRTKGGFATRKEAQAFLVEVLDDLREGVYVVPSRVTVREFMEDEWLPAIAPTVGPSTYRKYAQLAKTHIIPALGSVPLQALSGGRLNALYARLEATGLSPSTRRLVHVVMHRACGDAVRWSKLIRNPAASADPPRLSARKTQAWSSRELARFLEAVAADRLAAMWRLLAMTGARRGEALGLTWRCVDLDAGRIAIEQQLVATNDGEPVFAEPKTKRSRRTISLDASTVEALRRHRETQQLERDFLASGYADHDLVFAREEGRPLVPNRVTEAFAAHVKASKLPRLTLHGLRHSHVTAALCAGIPLHVVAARIGDTEATVLKTYAHLLPHSDAQAAEQVAALIAT